MKAPPLLPEETLLRVLRVARLDGLSVLVIAGVFALISALAGDGVGAVVGLLVAGAARWNCTARRSSSTASRAG